MSPSAPEPAEPQPEYPAYGVRPALDERHAAALARKRAGGGKLTPLEKAQQLMYQRVTDLIGKFSGFAAPDDAIPTSAQLESVYWRKAKAAESAVVQAVGREAKTRVSNFRMIGSVEQDLRTCLKGCERLHADARPAVERPLNDSLLVAAAVAAVRNPEDQRRQFERVFHLFLKALRKYHHALYLQVLAARDRRGNANRRLPIPRALLRATEPTAAEVRAVAPTRGPPSSKDQDNDPPLDARPGDAHTAPNLPLVNFANAGSADGPSFVAYLERRSLLVELRSHKHWTRQIRRWRVEGVRIDPITVDALMIGMFGEPACTIRADDSVWQVAKARAARVPTHSADAGRHSTTDLLVAA